MRINKFQPFDTSQILFIVSYQGVAVSPGALTQSPIPTIVMGLVGKKMIMKFLALEIKLDFGARVDDNRLGVVEKAKVFPSESRYIFAGNSPIVMTHADWKLKI